ncbi:SRPBCC family protein [Telmatospirillum siberiense]|uniref:SRPBCC family protein n=1 Tax=Telmatospirillum siberiense TaxID=382514 RepID=A0A2N3PUS1_9PROT|nr:SRPBCC family protein [Telmatospirillum siberiense]PKU24152.1 SRPBCC family protein [Telmatospirillum siberiense]
MFRKIIFTAILASAASFASGGSAHAIDVEKHVPVAAAPSAAWRAIGDFCGIAQWHPAVAKCELSRRDGITYRTLSLNGGGTLVEKLLSWDAAHRRYSYGIVDGPLPVAGYRSTISVRRGAHGAIITWGGTFSAKGVPDDKAKAVIAEIYTGGLDSLAGKLTVSRR